MKRQLDSLIKYWKVKMLWLKTPITSLADCYLRTNQKAAAQNALKVHLNEF